ncbi:cytidine/deoxycytidylate deaminase family protein [Polaribacter butkevichii]|uniref:CMP/dCMP-type deaminase domain-containing protein n=1 Tax=Polaribacter butkevichii TaxID=218490 RepID=A0A2P6CBB7_9FLAO|nr:hypothetical protein [Polaribacter butkevichii]PQJ72204.1 hypothetical protein BTO14_02595 [Polaribacter butkevichii]
MELTELYKLRRGFTIIGITGRTGSGCSKVSDILANDFKELEKGIRNVEEIDNDIFQKKITICKNYLNHNDNWQNFELIKYKDLLLFYLLSYYGTEPKKIASLLSNHFRESKGENNRSTILELSKELFQFTENEESVKKIAKHKKAFNKIKTKEQLAELHELFFGNDFRKISDKIFSILEKHGYYRRTVLLHHISCNIRRSGDPLNSNKNTSIEYIYSLAELTNRLIKAKKQYNDLSQKPTKIVIDSLRNSLEIMFFKERYAGFHMIATKDSNNRALSRVKHRLSKKIKDVTEVERISKKILELDHTEYKTSDYSKGVFSSPDVYNCIQKSDIHIINNRKDDLEDGKYQNQFFTIEEQILKFISLIQQPGIITPSSSERCMQFAFMAKLNSGCISRQVGAVVTDENYSVKAIGWNDVPSGQTPCNLRSADDYNSEKFKSNNYSDFEQGKETSNIEVDYKYKDKEPYDFPNAIKAYYNGKDTSINNKDLNGKNCSFCFKTIHNHFEGEKNQVHTKSLHAEENAMLQISKYGGQGLKGGILFTTASPCELCSKKASQLGIKKVYYIDPYPGISRPQILTNNRYQMELISFNGVIGKSYTKLYEPFMAYKDELQIMLENEPKDFSKTDWSKVIKNVKSEELKKELNKYINDKNLDEDKLISFLKQ